MAIQKHKTHRAGTRIPATGAVSHNLVRVAIGFPREQFDIINALAVHKGISFAEAARRLVNEALASDMIAKKVMEAA